MINNELTDTAVQREMGQRLSRYRLRNNWTQAQLAVEAGVSKRTIERLEAGESVQLSNWLRVLRAFGLVSVLDQLIVEPLASPVEQLKSKGKKRLRASTAKKTVSTGVKQEVPWQWDDG